MRNKLNDVYAFPDRIKSVLCACSEGKLSGIHFHSASKKAQSILNINFCQITSHHMCLRIPLFLDIFQLLQQTFSYFCATIDQNTLIGLKNNHFTTLEFR